MARDRWKRRHFGYRFIHALSGIGQALKQERNIKIQSFIGLVVILSGFYFHLAIRDWMIVFLLIGGVISLELVNSAIERTVDLVTSDKHPLAKAAKDMAAGAVLFFSIISVIVGALIFLKYMT